MDLLLIRDDQTSERSLGRLAVNGVFECFTCEPPAADLAPRHKHPCVPPGRYRVIVTMSRRFNRLLPELLEVPGREGIRIHPFNQAEESLGCIGPGLSRAHDGVISSRIALNQLQRRITTALGLGEQVWITIEERRAQHGTVDR